MYSVVDRRGVQGRLLVLAFVAVALGAIAVGTVPGTAAADHAADTDDRIQIVDAFNDTESTGNTVVAVRATTTDPVSDIEFVYDNGTKVGPLALDNSGVVGAQYNNGTDFSNGNSFSAGENDTVYFLLNQSWEPGPVELNASAGGQSYEAADQANRSVMTTNVYNVSVENASNDPVTSETPIAVFNSSSKTIPGFVTANNTGTFHCGGVLDGETCTDPDTNGNTAHTYYRGEAAAFPSSLAVRAFDPRTANASAQTDVTGSQTLTLNKSAAVGEYSATRERSIPAAGPRRP
jgi:hypothetical protein